MVVARAFATGAVGRAPLPQGIGAWSRLTRKGCRDVEDMDSPLIFSDVASSSASSGRPSRGPHTGLADWGIPFRVCSRLTGFPATRTRSLRLRAPKMRGHATFRASSAAGCRLHSRWRQASGFPVSPGWFIQIQANQPLTAFRLAKGIIVRGPASRYRYQQQVFP